MKKFRNIASLFDFRKDYQFLGNFGQGLYLWGAVDIVFMAFNLEEISRTIRSYGAGFYTGAIIWDMIKIGGGIAMKSYKRNQIAKEESAQQKISELENRVNQ